MTLTRTPHTFEAGGRVWTVHTLYAYRPASRGSAVFLWGKAYPDGPYPIAQIEGIGLDMADLLHNLWCRANMFSWPWPEPPTFQESEFRHTRHRNNQDWGRNTLI